jgi:hypothetical protein
MGFPGPVVGRSRSPIRGTIQQWATPPFNQTHPDLDEINALFADGQADLLRCIVVAVANRALPKPATCWPINIALLRRALDDFDRVDRGVRIKSDLGIVHLAPADSSDNEARNMADRHEAAWLVVPAPLLVDPLTRELACAVVFVSPNRSEHSKEYWRQRARQDAR